MGSRESKAQGKEEKTDSGDDNGADDASCKSAEFTLARAQKWRAYEEQVDRHVRDDHQRDKRDESFPFEIQRADVMSRGGERIASAVDDHEQKRQPGGCENRLPKGNRTTIQ